MDEAQTQSSLSARDWASILNSYREPDPGRSVFELAVTAGGFALVWLAMWATLGIGYWLTLLIAVPAAAPQGDILLAFVGPRPHTA